MSSNSAYNKALANLTSHDANREFVLLRDCGETIECIAAARASFIASCVSSLTEDLVEATEGNKEYMVMHLLRHSGLSRWQIFKAGVYALFSKDCNHMPGKPTPI
jgi:hypothetical protein